jgi:hypothetical protein
MRLPHFFQCEGDRTGRAASKPSRAATMEQKCRRKTSDRLSKIANTTPKENPVPCLIHSLARDNQSVKMNTENKYCCCYSRFGRADSKTEQKRHVGPRAPVSYPTTQTTTARTPHARRALDGADLTAWAISDLYNVNTHGAASGGPGARAAHRNPVPSPDASMLPMGYGRSCGLRCSAGSGLDGGMW